MHGEGIGEGGFGEDGSGDCLCSIGIGDWSGDFTMSRGFQRLIDGLVDCLRWDGSLCSARLLGVPELEWMDGLDIAWNKSRQQIEQRFC